MGARAWLRRSGWEIIGCGGIARGRHLTGLTALKRAGIDQCDVTAICDTVEENLDAAGAYLEKEHGVRPERYTSWEECLSRAPVDAVDVCLPHGLHHVVGIAALGAGLHVVMEKPYTVTVKTGRELATAGRPRRAGAGHGRAPPADARAAGGVVGAQRGPAGRAAAPVLRRLHPVPRPAARGGPGPLSGGLPGGATA